MKGLLKSFKKSEVAIYAIAIMLVAAGYLNYTTMNENSVIETSSKETTNTIVENTSIGDATLVNSDDILKENVTHNEENEENCRKTATHLDVHANAKINNLNNKQMEKYILFHFTDESTLAAPKCDLRINFSNSPYEVVNRLELKLKNIIAVK